MSPKSAPSTQPFTSDTQLLDAEFSYIRSRASRIAAERSAEVAKKHEDENDPLARRPGRVPSREASCRAREFLDEEQKLRAEIDTRLALHRADSNHPKLGIDVLCEEHHLSADERLVLLAAALPAISQKFAEDVLADLSFFGAISVAELIAVVFVPKDAGDWLEGRKCFRPEAPLRKAGLLILGAPHGVPGGDVLPSLDVRVALPVLGTLCGDVGMATELDVVTKEAES